MCTGTWVKHVYQGVQGACPQQAVTSAGVMAKHSERHDVGTGLKLVCSNYNKYFTSSQLAKLKIKLRTKQDCFIYISINIS